jgi:hypothetical protein
MADESTSSSSGKSSKWALRVGEKMSKLTRAKRDLAKQLADTKAELEKAPKVEDFTKLQREVTASKHRKVVEKAATELGLDPDRLDDLLKLSDYQAEGEPNPTLIKAFLGKASEGRDWAKAQTKSVAGDESGDDGDGDGDGGSTPPPSVSKLPKGEGHGKGKTDKLVGGLKVTQSQLKSPDWIRANKAEMHKHSAAGTLTILD